MALVDFTKIPQSANDGSQETPIMGKWDPVWGFVTVSQSLEFKYERESKYRTFGNVSIKGVFTLNASYLGLPDGSKFPIPSGQNPRVQTPDPSMDGERFNLLKSKYEALRDSFMFAGRQSAPYKVEEYGTASDLRCVKLPLGLTDSDGNPVYMRPVSLRIEETQWPNLISYNATLKEIPPIPCKISLYGITVDNPSLTINARKPNIRTVDYAFANSSDIFFSGWQSRSYSFNGSIPEVAPSGMLIPPSGTLALLERLMTGRITIEKTKAVPSGTFVLSRTESFLENLFVDSSSVSVSQDNSGRGVRISFNAKE